MIKLPVRKCYFIAKIGVIFLLAVTFLSLFERWRGGKRTATAQFADPTEEEYERQILEDEARIVPGLGADGAAAFLTGQDKILGEEAEKKFAINTYLSDRIPYNRTLTDFRNPACSRVIYDAELPSASVIIIFHNEPYSVVIRTIHSVLDSTRRDRPWHSQANFVDRETGRSMTLGYHGQDPTSEHVYLKEIILVDDNSTLPELRGKLSHYIATRLRRGMVRLLRLPDRQGLMRARVRGARAARGDVLVFLDAHCEAGADWLRPLLQRVRNKRDAVAAPVVDVIDQASFKLEAAEYFQVGGFTFAGHFTWIDVPEREKKRRGSDIAPTWSPTMAGGLFAISRPYYWELGAYDEQMAGWGGENLEISFRIWQCGGTLETIPCSRVGHVFRSFHPYGLPAETDTHGINTARMAEVWMDEYAELFYMHRPDLRFNPAIGDVTHRKILREKLHCKSFQWYLDNVYKEKFVPVRDVAYFGRVMNPMSSMCLDTMQREGDAVPLGIYPCHSVLSSTQYLSLSLAGQLRDEEDCATLQYTRRGADVSSEVEARAVIMMTCNDRQRGQKWRYLPNTKQLQHVESGLCLSALGAGAGADARARRCLPGAAQQWAWDYGEGDDGLTGNSILSAEQEERLRKLRGLRRKSRSLMSRATAESLRPSSLLPPAAPPAPAPAPAAPAPADSRRRRKRRRPKAKRKGKKKSHKNKFILLIQRTLMNNSEEHLELDVHCAHRKLLPNNSFVRDLVTILNDRNIRVINNGRVFERNRVTELGKLDPRSMRHRHKKVLDKMALPPAPPAPETRPDVPSVFPGAEKQSEPANEKTGAPASGKQRAEAPAPAPAAPEATTAGRIIVEDFVEIKRPAHSHSHSPPHSPKPFQRAHKRKSKSKSKAHTAVAAGDASAEDSPLMIGQRRGAGAVLTDVPDNSLDRASDDGYWTVGYGAPLRNSSRAHPLRQLPEEASDTELLDSSLEPESRRSASSVHRAAALAAQRTGGRVTDSRDTDTHGNRDRIETRIMRKKPLDKGSSENDKSAETTANEDTSAEVRMRAQSAEVQGEYRGKEREYAEVKGEGQNLEIIMDQSGNAPVKLVMKSNLTFNLGDELFARRRRPEDARATSTGGPAARRGASGSDSDASSASDTSD